MKLFYCVMWKQLRIKRGKYQY